MSRTEQELWDMLSQAGQLPEGRAKMAALETVIQHADAENLPELQYRARMSATRAYNYGGEPAKSIVTFSWCLAARDRGEADPSLDHSLYWYFKWIVTTIVSFPQIPLEQAQAVLDDMEQRYRLAGHTMGPVHQHRELLARHVGDRAEASEQYRLWGMAPRGEMSDCAACEPTSRVDHLAWLGRDAEAVPLAESVLSGRITCIEQPQTILTSLLVPYLRTGRTAAAADAHRRAYRALRSSRSEMEGVAGHVQFCALTGNPARGLELVQRHLGWLDEPPSPEADMLLSAAAARVLASVDDDLGVLRPGFGDRAASEVSAASLRDELSARAREIARQFDARNGSAEQSSVVDGMLSAAPLVDHVPLSAFPVKEGAAPAPSYPDTAEELADLAERERELLNSDAAAAVWRRFDEIMPSPTGLLLARRLDGRVPAGDDDVDSAREDWERAAELFAEAGDSARRWNSFARTGSALQHVGQVDAGIARIEAAIAGQAGNALGLHRAWGRLATTYMSMGEVDKAKAAGARAHEFAEQVGTASELGQSFMSLAILHGSSQEDLEKAREFAGRAVALLREAGSVEGLARVQLLEAQIYAGMGDFEHAYGLLAGVVPPASSTAVQATLLDTRSAFAMELDRPAEAVEHITAMTAIASPGGYTLSRLAAACVELDRYEQAANAAEQALALLQEDEDETATVKFLLSKAYTQLGLAEQALELLEDVEAHCLAQSNIVGAAQMRGLAGDLLDGLDRDAEAAVSFTGAADACREAEWVLDELINRRRAALSWHWARRPEEARSALALADSLAADLASSAEAAVVWERAMLGYDGARILAGGQELDAALVRVGPVAEAFRSVGASTEAAIAVAMQGRLLADLGRGSEAVPVLRQALAELPEEAEQQREGVRQLLADLGQS
ncbi:hypothetical protein [Actinocrispum sp. NPDC049592]|uniref:hypothetical protein n=1 Tax=Actinocrispum sp. NPDC049592 TaxID=3154835 RepID=UPI00341D272D